MQIFLRILKETGIAIIVLALVSLVVWLLFQKQLPFLGQDIPDAVEYAEINVEDYNTVGDIEDETNPTQVYEATNEQLTGYETDRYISTGLINPFSSNTATPDVPSERVTISNPTVLGTEETEGNTEIVASSDGSKSLE